MVGFHGIIAHMYKTSLSGFPPVPEPIMEKPSACMANDLKRMGGKKASLITTMNKGYRRPGNKRHPHSWSIAEPNDLVKWLLEHH